MTYFLVTGFTYIKYFCKRQSSFSNHQDLSIKIDKTIMRIPYIGNSNMADLCHKKLNRSRSIVFLHKLPQDSIIWEFSNCQWRYQKRRRRAIVYTTRLSETGVENRIIIAVNNDKSVVDCQGAIPAGTTFWQTNAELLKSFFTSHAYIHDKRKLQKLLFAHKKGETHLKKIVCEYIYAKK